MAEKKVGTVNYWRYSSDILGVFRLVPEGISKFPSYKAGQYMALQRNDCRLTKKVVGDEKKIEYSTVLDAQGAPKLGVVTHSYSIASAPFGTQGRGSLGF